MINPALPVWPARVIAIGHEPATLARGRLAEFRRHGVALSHVDDATTALIALGRDPTIAAVLVPAELPGMALADFLDVVRALSRTPVLLGVDAAYEPTSVALALDHGIAATVALPATPRALARAVTGVQPPPPPAAPRTYRCGDLELDADAFRVLWHGHPAHLSPRQFDMLRYLMAAHPRVVTIPELVAEFGPGGGRKLAPIRVGIRRLRDQLAAAAPDVPQPIETVHRVGYRIAQSAAPASPRSDTSRSTLVTTSSRTRRTPSIGSPAGSATAQSR